MSSLTPLVEPSPHTTFASSPVANDNRPEPSVPLEEEIVPNRSSDSNLPYSSHVPEVINSTNCSFNTSVSSRSFLDDPFPEQHTVVPPSRSVFPINTPITKTVTQRPRLIDALLKNAPSRMTTLSPIIRAEDNCPRLLRSNAVNQRHATAQHIDKQLSHELKNELGLETTQDTGSSGQSNKTTQTTSKTAARKRPIYCKLRFRSFDKNKGPTTGRKWPGDQKHTQKKRKNVSSKSMASLKHDSSTNRTAYTFVPILFNSSIFLFVP